jgi:hypothetical protein
LSRLNEQGIGLVVIAVTFAVVGLGSTVVLLAMVDDVNRTRPQALDFTFRLVPR